MTPKEALGKALDTINQEHISSMNAVLDEVRRRIAANHLPDDSFTLITTLELDIVPDAIRDYTQAQKSAVLKINRWYLTEWNRLDTERLHAIDRAADKYIG